MNILGIDPGIARCGWAVIEYQKSNIKYQKYGCIETKAGDSLEKRLLIVYKSILKIIEGSKPDAVAVEELFFNTNTKTALLVGQARGVVLLAGAQKNIPVFEYTPLQVKVAITGYGRGDKTQIGRMVKAILKLSEIPKPDDTVDALAVALTHAFSRKIEVLSKRK